MAGDFEPERDELGRFTSGGGGGAGAKEWAGAKGKGGTGKGGASAKQWAQKDAGAATSAAKLASIGAQSRDRGTNPDLHGKAMEAHLAAAKAHRDAGNESAAAAHEKRANEHKEERSAYLTHEAMSHAEDITSGAAKAPLRGKREWTGTQTNPDKMEFEGQFAGRGKQTIDDHFINGKPTDSRAQFHEEHIIGPAFAGKKTAAELGQKKPVAILTMGGPASGKGVVLSKMPGHEQHKDEFVHVDPDEVKGKLPEYQAQVPRDKGRTFIGAAAQVHEESSFVAKQIRDKAIAGGHNVIIDGTGGNAKKFVELINHLKEKGYDVHVHHPDLPVEEGVKRALNRAEGSGRHVPEKFIRETYNNIEKALPQIKEGIKAAGGTYHRYDATDNHKRVE